MAWIDCPNCGSRPTEEFRFGGELPIVPDTVVGQEARNLDYVWFFNNTDGPMVERWFHDTGCRRWLTQTRNTLTDRADTVTQTVEESTSH
jgi:heterotetrameric sarcosine oxidase delta subunit